MVVRDESSIQKGGNFIFTPPDLKTPSGFEAPRRSTGNISAILSDDQNSDIAKPSKNFANRINPSDIKPGQEKGTFSFNHSIEEHFGGGSSHNRSQNQHPLDRI
jgi:hypothetical protein